MKIWRHSPQDAVLAALSLGQLLTTFALAAGWSDASLPVRAGGGVLMIVMMSYNIIIISHLFTHAPWFVDGRMNSVVSALNSINIAQSVQTYQLTHVRNHHVFNNDRGTPDGATKDSSSTYRNGLGGEHLHVLPYALGGAAATLGGIARAQPSVIRLWRVGATETEILRRLSPEGRRREDELGQIRLDRAAQFLALAALTILSWQWVIFCYLPALYVSLALVNVQNYYEHYGADPEVRTSNSVSHYGVWYNRLTFNDGHHQEHHLNPSAHWSSLPALRRRYADRLGAAARIVSPVPAIVGFLDLRRPRLHWRPSPDRDLAASSQAGEPRP